MAEPQINLKQQLQQYHVHIKLNGENPKSTSHRSQLKTSHSCNGISLDFPPDMSAAESSSPSSERSASNSPCPELMDGNPEISPRFDGAAGGFYFDRTPPSKQPANGMLRGSPPRKEMPLNLKEYHDNVLAARNHRIYAIDELSEVSGRSDMVAMHERMRMEQVHEILANQERQARRERPASRKPGPTKEVKVHRAATAPSPADSPPYGVDSPPVSNRVSFRKCRILIPPNHQSNTDDTVYSQAFDAFIFDLDLATVNHSMTSLTLSQFPSRRTSYPTSQHPSNQQTPDYRFSRRSSDRMTGFGTGNSRIPSRSEAVPQRSNSSCCACFGFGGGTASERPSKNDWRPGGGGGGVGGGSYCRDTGRSVNEKDRLI